MQELFINNNQLVVESEWKDRITALKLDTELAVSEEKIAKEVKKLFEEAMKIRLEDVDEVGVCFSGGLDSSYIAALCKKSKANFTCYTVGFQDGDFKNPEDSEQAALVATFLKLNDDEFQSKIFTLKEMEYIIKKTVKILNASPYNTLTKLNHVVNIGVGGVVVAAHAIAKKESVFFSGLGSEEIFAGYDRHKKNPTNEECFQGLLHMYQRDLLRDATISSSLKFSFSTPFLDATLMKYALAIPIQYKVNAVGSKMILRKAAVFDLGKFSERPKKAAQYGSSFDRAIAKLTKKKGFEFKKDYLDSL